jgi:CRP/FNR family cyclic AMP-dependent transcriptional regulator
MRIEAMLARVEWLAPLGESVLRQLASEGRRSSLQKDNVLWRRGQRPDAVAVVLTGRLDIIRDSARGDRMLLRSIGAGEAVGLSTLASVAHSANVVAGEASSIFVLTGATLRDRLRREPAVALGAIARLGELVGNLTDELEELRFLDLDERVERVVFRRGRGLREVRLTHEELAQQVGATRENVSRALKRLERRGRIVCRRGRIELRS